MKEDNPYLKRSSQRACRNGLSLHFNLILTLNKYYENLLITGTKVELKFYSDVNNLIESVKKMRFPICRRFFYTLFYIYTESGVPWEAYCGDRLENAQFFDICA